MMKKIATALFVAISMAVVALPASAGPVTSYTVTFTGVGGQSTAGVYVYPYNFTIENNTTLQSENVQMMCIDFNREIFLQNPNETWQANLVNITSSPLPGDALSAHDLDTLAVLDAEIVAASNPVSGPIDTQLVSDLQFAAWRLTASNADETTGPYHAGFTPESLVLLNAASDEVTLGTSGVNFAAYSYFDPTSWPGSPATANDPQRFLIETTNISTKVIPPVPEPSSLALLGTGILGLASLARRRIVKA